MDERILQFKVGVVVLAAFFVTGILAVIFGLGPAILTSQYTVYINFEEAPGVTAGTPVRQSGVLIGRVKKVELPDGGGVRVTANIDSGRKLWTDQGVRVGSGSLLGDAVLEFIPSDQPNLKHEPVTDGAYIDGSVSSSPLDVIVNLETDIRLAVQSVSAAGSEVQRLAENLNTVVGNNQDQMQRIVQKSEAALDNFNLAMTSINGIVGDDELKGRLQKSLNELPDLLNESRQMIASMERMANRAETNLTNLEGFTEPLGRNGPRIVGDLSSSVSQIDEFLGQLTEFSRTLNSEDGTLGQLVHNPDLYQNLNRAALNIEQASRDLKPILHDARIFTDKVAREPGRVINLREALQKRMPIK